ncbi:MAG: alpha-galactosidase [Bryobacteraceae bacterium]
MLIRAAALVLGMALVCGAAFPQEAVRYLPDRKVWVLQAGESTYAFGVNERNELQNIYWGKTIARDEDFAAAHTNPEWASFDGVPTTTPEEYPGWGGVLYIEPCVKVTLQDGVRDLVLDYVSYRIQGNTLEIVTKDIRYGLYVTLSYHVYPDEGIIEKHSTIENRTGQPLVVESAQSGVWTLPRGDGYRLSYLTGRWAGETQLIQEDIHPGIKQIESRRGATSHQANPWFAIDASDNAGGHADQAHGRVWFGALGWSGSWKFSLEQTPHQQVRVTGGYNTFDFGYALKPGEKLDTPPFYGGFTDGGLGEASRMLHRFERESILPRGLDAKLRPVLYNSWEATEFNVNQQGQEALARKAAKLGVERFVMDDGWFGERNNDHAGLGDWFVNPQKFPHGLGPLIQYVNNLGMDFGLWVEPEMVNPDSQLYRQHPDWAMHFPGRPRTEERNQLVLNMAREDVKEYVFSWLDKLVSENNIAFLKWDMNRNFAEPGWPEAGAANEKKIWVRYTKNVYDIIDRLRAKHPKLEIESCSGGGGRVDLGILKRVDEVWTSDNTEAFDRLKIQEGFSYAYTPQVMMDWVTDVPNFNGRSTPLQYRFLVAMMGSLGIGSNLNKFTEQDDALAARMIAYYKSIRQTVQQGKLYRLFSPRMGELTANEYVSEDGKQAVLFAFLRSQQFGRPAPTIRLRGLDEKSVYRIKPMDGKLEERLETASGSYLQNHGLNFRLTGDYSSTSVVLERVQ